MGFHHVLCQTIVHLTGAPHAAVNAVMVPHTFRHVLPRAHAALEPFVEAVTAGGDDAAVRAVADLAALSGVTRLSQLGVDADDLAAVATASSRRPELARPAPAPDGAELRRLLDDAL